MSFKYRKHSEGYGLPRHGFNLLLTVTCLFWVNNLTFAQASEQALMELNPHQTSFHIGEPVILDLSIINASPNMIEFAAPSLETQTLEITIKKNSGNFQSFESDIVKEPIASPLSLPSSELVRNQILIHFNGAENTLVFSDPANYSIKASYVGYFDPENSAPDPAELAIEIIENLPEDEVFANFFSQSVTADFLTNISRDPGVIQQLQDLINQYPGSLYVPYGKYYLALFEARQFPDREPNLRRAIELMTAADLNGFQLQADAVYQLGDWQWQLGDATSAFALLDRCISQFPGTTAAFRAGLLRAALQGETPPEPPPPEEFPLEGTTKDAIEATLNDYFNAFEQQDTGGILSLLDTSFVYNDSLGRDDMSAELAEDFAKLGSANLTVTHEFLRQIIVEGTPIVELRISYHANGSLIPPPIEATISFVDAGGVWLLKSWKKN